ncbi:hypothetical protein M413DRAFT_27788 [Hebeloma cylindrosporum]|uniref:F-box domain-containing protein n=1 Tax=Hebeloma cylindrosporum TaxID=76867 RepID=A0A0C3CCV0_HEBCY|nr:hypothetical protein M413DRAFT_27788 [Hebeloma cylindrosporum h7]
MPVIYSPKSPYFADNIPPEILASVFANIVTSHSYHYTEEVAAALDEEALTFRRASQVSRFWRDVSLHQCKRVWGSIINIDTSGSDWVQELITRSSNFPLTIQSLPSRRKPIEDFHGNKWTSVLSQMARVKVLHFTLGCHEDASRLVYATSNLQAPILESFRVGYKCLCGVTPTSELFSFNGRLFDGHCPNLSDFVLTQVPFIQPTLEIPVTRLVHLDITPDLFSVGPTVSQWLDLLQAQPSLRYLTIAVPSMYNSTRNNPITLRQVHLPNLEELSIETPGIEGALIFESLVLPSRCGIAIRITEPDDDFDGLLQLLNSFGESIHGCVNKWSGKSSTKKVGSWGLEVDQQHFAFRLGSEDDEWYNPRIQLHYRCLDDPEDEEGAVLTLLPFFLDMIQTKGIIDAAHSCALDIQIPILEPIGLVPLLSRCAGKVTDLRLMGHSLWLVAGLFNKPDRPLFPALNHITLDGPYMEEVAFGYAYGYFERFLNAICDAGRGIPMTTLRVRSDYEFHTRFAEKAKRGFGSRIEEYVPHGTFEDFSEPRYWVRDDELRAMAV